MSALTTDSCDLRPELARNRSAASRRFHSRDSVASPFSDGAVHCIATVLSNHHNGSFGRILRGADELGTDVALTELLLVHAGVLVSWWRQTYLRNLTGRALDFFAAVTIF